MWNDKKLNSFVTSMKRKRVKVLLTIKAFDNTNIERLVASDDAQKRFIANAVQLTQSKSLDGINLDFEYIGTADEKTRLGFVRLVENLRAELTRQQPDAQLTAATYITSGAHANFFEISLLQDSLDAFVVMGYDIHTPKGSPGPVAPLEGPDGIIGYMQSYLERVPAEKLILAVPYYGYAWPDNGQPGRTLAFAEAAAISRKTKINWNSVSQTPSFTYVEPDDGQTYTAHFDNARSLGLKYDFVNSKDLKGVGIWALGYDGLNQELQQVLLEKFSN
jgi:spore germination protein YaaH